MSNRVLKHVETLTTVQLIELDHFRDKLVDTALSWPQLYVMTK